MSTSEKYTKPPKPGTKRYKKIVKRGCGGRWYNTPLCNEFDCDYDYPWECDDCPINVENNRERLGEAVKDEYLDIRKIH